MTSEKEFARQLYGQYGFMIYRTCRRILGSDDDAKDALQIVFLKLLEHYDAIDDKEKVVPWLFNTAKNHCFNLLRFNLKFRGTQDPDLSPQNDTFDDRTAAREIIRLVFRDQDRNLRDAVYYTFVEEYDQREIRKLTGQSPATIRRNLKRFKERVPWIRKRLEI